MSRPHAGLVATLVVGTGGLAGVLVWGIRMRGGDCSQYVPPGWLIGTVLFWGVAVMLATFLLSLSFEEQPRKKYVYVMTGLAEMGAAVAVVVYLTAKSAHAYWCG